MIDEYYTFKIFGYHSDELSHGTDKRVVAVCDYCGIYRDLAMNKYNDMCRSCTHKHGTKAQRSPKTPLPDGWNSKLSDITNNKECSTYLGSIAEIILSNIYDNVQVMPNCNHGYDVICNRDYKIDIKSSATGDKGHWMFNIKKNMCADYFLCLAFNDRDDLYNPVHLWLIPAYKINHLTGLSISKGTIDKWKQYELSLDKLLMCCDTLSNNNKERII